MDASGGNSPSWDQLKLVPLSNPEKGLLFDE
jgi:hypothetical protein